MHRAWGKAHRAEGRGIGIRISECGMRNDGIALLSLFYVLIKDPQEWTSKFKTDRFVITYQ